MFTEEHFRKKPVPLEANKTQTNSQMFDTKVKNSVQTEFPFFRMGPPPGLGEENAVWSRTDQTDDDTSSCSSPWEPSNELEERASQLQNQSFFNSNDKTSVQTDQSDVPQLTHRDQEEEEEEECFMFTEEHFRKKPVPLEANKTQTNSQMFDTKVKNSVQTEFPFFRMGPPPGLGEENAVWSK